MKRPVAGFARHAIAALVLSATLAHAQDEARDVEEGGAYSFAVMSGGTSRGAEDSRATLQAIGRSASRFVVHFDADPPSREACSASGLDARRALLDASAKPAVPVVSAAEWADCGSGANEQGDGDRRAEGLDASERLARVGDALFASDQSAGVERLRWTRQSAQARFSRYRENVRWQYGRVLFATFNLPANNNNFRRGAGRNGEFEERAVANRAWLDRTFRIASERRVAGIVLFVDAAPRFAHALRAPDPTSGERDGYYEWKAHLVDLAQKFRGEVLIVQGDGPRDDEAPPLHAIRDAAGRPIPHLMRMVVPEASGNARWVRIDVDSRRPSVFSVTRERVFDDPSGELYGGKVR